MVKSFSRVTISCITAHFPSATAPFRCVGAEGEVVSAAQGALNDSQQLERWLRAFRRGFPPCQLQQKVFRCVGTELERFPYIALQLDSHLPAES